MSDIGKMKTALVTGALGQTGSLICERLMKSGYFVIGTDVKPGTCRCASFVNVDLRKLIQEESRSFFEQYVRSLTPFGALDLLVNNATLDEDSAFDDVTVENWYDSLDINLLVPFTLIRALREQLCAGDGLIVNTGNLHAYEGSSQKHCYAATKSALEGLSKTIALEFEGRLSIYTIATHADSNRNESKQEISFAELVSDSIYDLSVSSNRPRSGTTITIA